MNAQDSAVHNNVAGSPNSSNGMGGGLYMGDKCAGSSCTQVSGTLTNVNFTGNYAHMVRRHVLIKHDIY